MTRPRGGTSPEDADTPEAGCATSRTAMMALAGEAIKVARNAPLPLADG
ncbi:hypothetical protein ACFFP0_09650 [Rhizobium puerariae]|uniref:Uncharacterized protein n=1 Tax=Rhizobium puerariae TaxID=1585791 RepID=A0ABV6AEQ3_9HYPH